MPIPGPLDANSGPPQININHPDRPRTFCQPRPHGGFTLGQGRNRISLSRVEAERLTEVMSAGSDAFYSTRYTTTTPAKAKLMRYPMTAPSEAKKR
jgi:hypothetical protein